MPAERRPSVGGSRPRAGPGERWYDGLPPVRAEIRCGGVPHRIAWRDGRLILEDHDALAERSLAAFGTPPPMCVEVLEAWRALRSPELLCECLFSETLLPAGELARRRRQHLAAVARMQETGRRHGLRLPADRPRRAEAREILDRQAAERLEVERRAWASTVVAALPAALRRALALSVVAKVERSWHDEEYRRLHARPIESALTALAMPLFERSARRWWRALRPSAGCVAEALLLPPGGEPTCAAWLAGGGAFAALSLPVSWFIDVWASGIALVDDCLVLGITDRPREPETVPVLALRWQSGARPTSRSAEAPAVVTRGRSGGWVLRWV